MSTNRSRSPRLYLRLRVFRDCDSDSDPAEVLGPGILEFQTITHPTIDPQ